MKPVTKKSIVKNVIIATLSKLYDLNIVRVCSALRYHRHVYYDVKRKFVIKLDRSEESVADALIKTYKLDERMTASVVQIDPATIVAAEEELFDLLGIDADVRDQIDKSRIKIRKV